MNNEPIDGQTRTLGVAQGYNGLHIRDGVLDCSVAGPTPVMVSSWAPDATERAAIAAGASVVLEVCGTRHPPVRLTVAAPPDTHGCPFDTRLYRTAYLVLPKLAIQAMPMGWRARFEALLREADDAGLETPAYTVLRDDPAYTRAVPSDPDDPTGYVGEYHVMDRDPWADYRRGNAAELCPGFRVAA